MEKFKERARRLDRRILHLMPRILKIIEFESQRSFFEDLGQTYIKSGIRSPADM